MYGEGEDGLDGERVYGMGQVVREGEVGMYREVSVIVQREKKIEILIM